MHKVLGCSWHCKWKEEVKKGMKGEGKRGREEKERGEGK
jgi:hypothetical protein